MHPAARRLLVAAVTTAVTAGALSAVPSAAFAAAGTATAPAAAPAASAQALPPYDTWISDVTAVTDQAARYLSGRLPDPTVRAAIVLDIDNTALQSTYKPGIYSPATPSVLAVAEQAHNAGAAVIFVTARPEILRPLTVQNLSNAGYPDDGLYMRPWFDGESDQSLKTAARTTIEGQGYTIVANIGNNDSDLAGGHAERTFKLPDYGGQLN